MRPSPDRGPPGIGGLAKTARPRCAGTGPAPFGFRCPHPALPRRPRELPGTLCLSPQVYASLFQPFPHTTHLDGEASCPTPGERRRHFTHRHGRGLTGGGAGRAFAAARGGRDLTGGGGFAGRRAGRTSRSVRSQGRWAPGSARSFGVFLVRRLTWDSRRWHLSGPSVSVRSEALP